MKLMNYSEMKQRYDDGGDSLELTILKWQRILEQSRSGCDLPHFQAILRAAVVPIFLCAEYSSQCTLCPIYRICHQGTAGEWTRLMRVVQAYAIAGDLLPREALEDQIAGYLEQLQLCRDEQLARCN